MLKKRLGEMLVAQGKLDPVDLKTALDEAKQEGMYLGEYLIEKGLVDEMSIASTLSEQLDIPLVDISKNAPSPELLLGFPKRFAEKHIVVPIKVQEGKLYTAMADPLNIMAIEDIEFSTGMPVERCVAPRSQILQVIERAFPGEEDHEPEEDAEENVGALVSEKHKGTVIGLVSNKGGVGKTHIAVNLAYWLASKRKRVLLIDGDFQNPDVPVKVGFKPPHTLVDLHTRELEIEGIVAESMYRFDVISGIPGDTTLANLNHAQRTRFVRQFARVSRNYDFVIYDFNTGVQSGIIDIALGCDQVVVVATPQTMVSADGCVKAAFARFKQNEESLGKRKGDHEKKVAFAPSLIVNQVVQMEDGEKLFKQMKKSLQVHYKKNVDDYSLRMRYLGAILYDSKSVIGAEEGGRPVSEAFPKQRITECFEHLAGLLIHPPTDTVEKVEQVKFKSKFQKFRELFAEKSDFLP